MTVLNTTSPLAIPPDGSAPMRSPSKTLPSASTSAPSRASVIGPGLSFGWSSGSAYSSSLVHGHPFGPPDPRRRGPHSSPRCPPSSSGGHPLVDHEVPVEDRVRHPSPQGHADVGGVAAAAGELRRHDLPLHVGVEHREYHGFAGCHRP